MDAKTPVCRAIGLLMLLAAFGALSGCAQRTADYYADFLMNEDILMRFEVCYADVRDGHDTAYTEGELRALQQDMEYGYRCGDEEAARATDCFREAAALLAEAHRAKEPLRSDLLAQAREVFDRGWRISADVREGAYEE